MGLKVNIKGLRFRASDGRLNTAAQLRILQQRLNGTAGVSRIRAGENPEASNNYLALRRPVTDIKVEPSQIPKPEMIDHPELPFKVMEGVLAEISLPGGREYAQKLNQQEPGRKFRVPTKAELLKLNKLLEGQLDGIDYWIWTETESEKCPGRYVLLNLYLDGCIDDHPETLSGNYAVRLVEDK